MGGGKLRKEWLQEYFDIGKVKKAEKGRCKRIPFAPPLQKSAAGYERIARIFYLRTGNYAFV